MKNYLFFIFTVLVSPMALASEDLSQSMAQQTVRFIMNGSQHENFQSVQVEIEIAYPQHNYGVDSTGSAFRKFSVTSIADLERKIIQLRGEIPATIQITGFDIAPVYKVDGQNIPSKSLRVQAGTRIPKASQETPKGPKNSNSSQGPKPKEVSGMLKDLKKHPFQYAITAAVVAFYPWFVAGRPIPKSWKQQEEPVFPRGAAQ